MPTPGQILWNEGLMPDTKKVRMNRAGIKVEGQPGLIDKAVPPDTYEGMFSINTPQRVDLLVSKRDKSRVSIKYTVEE
jgi:hypothetical protein